MKIKIWTIKNVICLQFIEIDKLEKYRNNGKIFTGRYFSFQSWIYPGISSKTINLPGSDNSMDYIPFSIIEYHIERDEFLSRLKKDIELFGNSLQ